MHAFFSSSLVIVVGGGHAGCEAALACARKGTKTLLITQNLTSIGQMSCNPAIGGIGKSHLTREIDALDGYMACAADKSAIHIRTLNRSRGFAVQAIRAQTDRTLYACAIREKIEEQDNLSVFQDDVEDLILKGDCVRGVVTKMGLKFFAPYVILTVGTFLDGCIHVGEKQFKGGRMGDKPATKLAAKLRDMSFRTGRLKTGTPPRLDGKSIDFTALTSQPSESPRPIFSYLGKHSDHPKQVPCYITYTNEKTHDIVRASLHKSPMYNDQISSKGPRYCPSLEDKVVRFREKSSHRIFLEPEGLHTREIYPNGISTCLPFDIQLKSIQTILGLERAQITRPGYAIEYDYFDPRDLHPWLETRHIQGLFFAGQINGTTGYEEAGAQGLIAGINAALRSCDEDPWWPRRENSFIGVMLDDLTSLGVSEPYRMFTSRAEYRLRLRQDNADMRLTEIGRKLKIVGEERWNMFLKRKDMAKELIEMLHSIQVDDEILAGLPSNGKCKTSAFSLLRRGDMSLQQVANAANMDLDSYDQEILTHVAAQVKYSAYLRRQDNQIKALTNARKKRIPYHFDYHSVPGLSTELRNKLDGIRPCTLGDANYIEGITPAALSLLQVYISKIEKEACRGVESKTQQASQANNEYSA